MVANAVAAQLDERETRAYLLACSLLSSDRAIATALGSVFRPYRVVDLSAGFIPLPGDGRDSVRAEFAVHGAQIVSTASGRFMFGVVIGIEFDESGEPVNTSKPPESRESSRRKSVAIPVHSRA